MIIDRSSIRYCPKCGSGDLIRPVTRNIVCRACDFVLYFNAASAVASLIVNEQGQLLTVVRGQEPQKGTLDLPGGFVDLGEDAEQAIRREIQEELGLEVATLTYLCSEANTYPYRGMLYHTADVIYLCQAKDAHKAKPADDVAAIQWLAPGDIKLDDFGFESIRNAIRRYLNS